MNTDTLISMMLAPILIKLAEQLLNWLSRQFSSLYSALTSITSDATVIIESTATQQGGYFNYSRDYIQARELMGAISEFLFDRGTYTRTATAQFIGGELGIRANGGIQYKGYKFEFSSAKTSNGDNGVVNTTDSLVIYHKNPAKIRAFIEKCSAAADRKSDYSFKQKYYGQSRDANAKTVHVPLEFAPTTTIDDLFFPQKHLVERAIDELMSGERKKLSFYMHGEPGCGKTSITRMIAAKTGYSAVEIRLADIPTDDCLRNIIFNEYLYVSDRGHAQYRKIDVKRRIYLFEDIDADCDVVYRRDLVKPPVKPLLSSASSESSAIKMGPELTLSGILNVLDGILEISGSIVVITTNHPEKLDPALVRPGRVTHNICMKRMTSECAAELVARFHPEWCGRIRDGQYTPSELEAICQTHTLEELADVICDVEK